jgi:hypothetical protein
VRDASLRKYLHKNASIEVGKPFSGYTATIWIDKYGEIGVGSRDTPLRDAKLYYYGREYFSARYGETFTETDLWDFNIPTFEEYGEWTSVQAHAFALRLLAPAGTATHSNYLRAFSIDSDILRAVGVRYVLTDAEALDKPSVLRGSVSDPSSPRTPPVRLFELSNPNLGTYIRQGDDGRRDHATDTGEQAPSRSGRSRLGRDSVDNRESNQRGDDRGA